MALCRRQEDKPSLEVPEGPPTKWARWGSAEFAGSKLDAVYECIWCIREAGVTGQMVARDFTRRRIAPLQWHSEPVWTYTGRGDAMRLSSDDFTPEVLQQVMGVLFVSPKIPSPSDERAKPLICFAEESIEEQCQIMPVFDEWGIVPAGHRGPRPNPWARPRSWRRLRSLKGPLEARTLQARKRPRGAPAPEARTRRQPLERLREFFKERSRRG